MEAGWVEAVSAEADSAEAEAEATTLAEAAAVVVLGTNKRRSRLPETLRRCHHFSNATDIHEDSYFPASAVSKLRIQADRTASKRPKCFFRQM